MGNLSSTHDKEHFIKQRNHSIHFSQKALNIILLNFYKNESNPLKVKTLQGEIKINKKRVGRGSQIDYRFQSCQFQTEKSFNKLFLKCISILYY